MTASPGSTSVPGVRGDSGGPDHGGPLSDTLDHDVTCLGCGYNLRTLSIDGQCPECGRSVASSVHGDLLRYADAAWLRRVQIGMRLVYWSVITALLTTILAGIAFTMALPNISGGVSTSFLPPLILTIAAIPSSLLPVIYPIGWWLATAPDPAETRRRSIERTLLRWSALLAFPAEFAWHAHRVLPWPWASDALFIEVKSHVCFGLVWLHIIMMLRSLRTLHERRRADNRRRYERLSMQLNRSLGTAYRFPIALVALHGLLSVMSVAKSVPTPPMMIPGYGWGTGIGPIMITLMWLSSISLCHGVLREIRAERAAQRERLASASAVSP